MDNRNDNLKDYQSLVDARKKCQRCTSPSCGLTNPSAVQDGKFDSDQIGPWTRWNGDLNARIVVIGQEWGGVKTFERQFGLDIGSRTNQLLHKLLASIGIAVDEAPANRADSGVFLTNAALCLKQGGDGAPVDKAWFETCGNAFLKPQIELINPRVVVTLGERAYLAVRDLYSCPRTSFRRAANCHQAISLGSGRSLIPVYHCSPRVQSRHRPPPQQFADWAFVKKELDRI